jgi:hypothetical protein
MALSPFAVSPTTQERPRRSEACSHNGLVSQLARIIHEGS